jgi:DNA helicase ZGRF1-like, N-terminal domain
MSGNTPGGAFTPFTDHLFAVLYTHQKQRKRKVYQDGRLHLRVRHAAHSELGNAVGTTITGGQATLSTEEGRELERVRLSADILRVLLSSQEDELEFERFLVQIDHPLPSPTTPSAALPRSVGAHARASEQRQYPTPTRKLQRVSSHEIQVGVRVNAALVCDAHSPRLTVFL